MFLRAMSPTFQLLLSIQGLVVLWSFVFIWGVALTLYVHHVFMCFPLLTVLVALMFIVPGLIRPNEGFTTYLMTGGSGRYSSNEVDASKSDIVVRYTAIRDDESGFVDIDLRDDEDSDDVR